MEVWFLVPCADPNTSWEQACDAAKASWSNPQTRPKSRGWSIFRKCRRQRQGIGPAASQVVRHLTDIEKAPADPVGALRCERRGSRARQRQLRQSPRLSLQSRSCGRVAVIGLPEHSCKTHRLRLLAQTLAKARGSQAGQRNSCTIR